VRIAIDSGPLVSGHKVRGIGFYTKNLIESLGDKVKAVDFSSADLNKFDVVHIPFFNPFFVNIPTNTSAKVIVTIHDVIPLIHPKHYPPGIKGSIRLLINKILLKKVRAVITDTEASKKDIVRLLGVPVNKVYTTHLAPGKEFQILETKDIVKVKEKYNLPDKFALYVGDVNYNKNIPGLIKACKQINTTLVVVGKQALDIEGDYDLVSLRGPRDWFRFVFGISHPQIAHFKGMTNEFKDKGIIRLGFLPENDLVALYNLATVYCQPSFYEGFGLPVLEAMACGLPVVAARTQALVEIGEPACLFANPKDPSDIADKINRVIKNKSLRLKLIKAGLDLVKNYSWDKTAKETFEVYKNV
jgi:glycosyltransferase involved in cell wall biosynthesis